MRTTMLGGVKVTNVPPYKIFNNLLASFYRFHSLCLLILMPYHLYFLCSDSFFSLVQHRNIFTSLRRSHAIRYCNRMNWKSVIFSTIYRALKVRKRVHIRRPNLLIISMSNDFRFFLRIGSLMYSTWLIYSPPENCGYYIKLDFYFVETTLSHCIQSHPTSMLFKSKHTHAFKCQTKN